MIISTGSQRVEEFGEPICNYMMISVLQQKSAMESTAS